MPEQSTPIAVVKPNVWIAGVELSPIKQKAKLTEREAKVQRLKLKSSFFSLV